MDRVESLAIDLAKDLFKAEFVDVRPVSGVCANLISYTVFTKPGDTIMALSIPNGGHISYGKEEIGGTAGRVKGLNVEYFPFDSDEMNIDVDKTMKKIERLTLEGKKPKMVVFGASVFLFPHPIKELEGFLHTHNITIMYDAAHVLGLIAGKTFQDPLREGADIMTGSTHKTLPGPQGGIVITWERYSELVKRATFPGNVSNHHLHHVAGKAVVFAEMMAFGEEYARQVIANAKRLAESLSEHGIKVLGEKHGFTKSHQILIDVTKFGDGGTLEKELEKANIIVNRNMIPSDIKAKRHYMHPGGIRIGVQEVTRLGMKESEMDEIARLLADVIVHKKNPVKVAKEVAELRRAFRRVEYAFESPIDAYEYITLRR